MLRAGDKIDSFTLIKELGKGGFGVVWLAEERTIFAAPRVALKIALEDRINLEAIKQEANLWVQASGHINVLPIFGVRICDEHVVIISEYAPDGSLEEWLNQHGDKAPSVEAAVDIAYGILAGLEHLHSKGVIHRDLKPANILLQGETPRLTDFGLARLLKSSVNSLNVEGTLPYMAPEVFSGGRSEQTDIWSAGVIFYRLLVGSLPFPQQDIRSLIYAIDTHDPSLPSSVPVALEGIITKALQKEPAQRYKSATEMRKALRAASRALMLPKPEGQETPAPPLQGETQEESQAFSTSVHSSATQLAGTVPMPPPSVPLPDVRSEQRAPEQAQPVSKSKGVWWIIGGLVSLLTVGILIVAVLKKFPSQPLNQQPPAAEAKTSGDAKLHANQGKVLVDRSEFAQAESEYRKALQLDGNNADYRLKLAMSLSGQNKDEEAQSEYREAERLARESLRTEPGEAANHYYLGYALLERDKLTDAEAELREAIRLNSNNGDYHDVLGLTLSVQLKYAEAEVECGEAIRLNPDEYLYHSSLGIVLSRQDKYVKAEAELRESIRLNPNSTRAHRLLGIALSKQNKRTEAEAECREAVRLNPENDWAHSNLGKVLETQKKYAEAESEYKEAIRLHPNEFQHPINLGDFLLNRRRYTEAEVEYKKAETGYKEAIRLDPDKPKHRLNLGTFLLGRKRYAEMEAAYREAIRLNSDEPRYHNELGVALYYQKKYVEAEVEYREATHLNPSVTLYRDNLGGILFTQKKYAEAEAEYKVAIRLYPDEPAYHDSLANFLLDRKRYAEAEAAFREAIRLNPNAPSYHNSLGIALDRQKKYVEAEVEYREAVRLDPNEPLYHNNVGIILRLQKKYAAAQAEFKEAERLRKK